MLIAVIFLGKNAWYTNQTLKSLDCLMTKMDSKYITFSILNDEDYSHLFDVFKYQNIYEEKDRFNLYLTLISEYETKNNIKFDSIFVLEYNSLLTLDYFTVKFYPEIDYVGGDIFNFTETKHINELFDHMITLGSARSFNTNGYYKENININNFTLNKYFGPNGGTFLKITDQVKYITTSPELMKELNIDTFTYVKNLTMLSTEFYTQYKKEFKFSDKQLDQCYLDNLYLNVYHYDKTPEIDCKELPVFFVNSVINVSKHDNKWTPTERLKQTVQTLTSIKKQVPDSVVILVEGSRLNQKQMKKLSMYTDYLILFNDDLYINNYVNHSNKSMFEIYSILHLLKNNVRNYPWMVKLSGRYRILNGFDRDIFFSNKPTFFHNSYIYSQNYVFPVFYSIPYSLIENYTNFIESMGRPGYHNIEHIMFCFCYRNNLEINFIQNGVDWVAGFVAHMLTYSSIV